MSETTTKAPKAKKSAPKAKAKSAAPVVSSNGELTGSEIKILSALTKVESANRDKLRSATGIQKGYSKILGASTKEDYGSTGSDSLCGRGYVKVLKIEGERQFRYQISATGRKALEKAKGK